MDTFCDETDYAFTIGGEPSANMCEWWLSQEPFKWRPMDTSSPHSLELLYFSEHGLIRVQSEIQAFNANAAKSALRLTITQQGPFRKQRLIRSLAPDAAYSRFIPDDWRVHPWTLDYQESSTHFWIPKQSQLLRKHQASVKGVTKFMHAIENAPDEFPLASHLSLVRAQLSDEILFEDREHAEKIAVAEEWNIKFFTDDVRPAIEWCVIFGHERKDKKPITPRTFHNRINGLKGKSIRCKFSGSEGYRIYVDHLPPGTKTRASRDEIVLNAGLQGRRNRGS